MLMKIGAPGGGFGAPAPRWAHPAHVFAVVTAVCRSFSRVVGEKGLARASLEIHLCQQPVRALAQVCGQAAFLGVHGPVCAPRGTHFGEGGAAIDPLGPRITYVHYKFKVNFVFSFKRATYAHKKYGGQRSKVAHTNRHNRARVGSK